MKRCERTGLLGVALMGGAITMALFLLGRGHVTAQAAMAPGFSDTVVLSGLESPTAVRFSPDGRVFVAEKSGVIKVFQSLSDTEGSVFADLRTNVHNYWDRGLLSLALDPSFPSRPYMYVLYTFDGPIGGAAPRWGAPGQTSDPCPDPPGATAQGCEVSARLSRLQASGNVMTGTERVLIHDWFQQFPGHSIGDLAFGPDGALYVSGGDGASFQFVDYGQRANPGGDPPVGVGGVQTPPAAEGGALRSQDVRTTADPAGLSGTVSRVDPATGLALPDNPMYASADRNTRRIVAYGFRNPFRTTVQPGTGELWVADVGWRGAEEINRISNPLSGSVRNFGWPCYEGAGRQSGYDAANLALCESLYATSGAVTAPHFQYLKGFHVVDGETCPSAGASITGLAFYRGGSYPARYNGALFFADYTRRCIWVMLAGADGVPNPATRSTFRSGAAYPVDLQVGPGGDIFYVDLGGGAVHRIRYSSDNMAPQARVTASPTAGLAPLTVQFDGRSSSDTEDAVLAYDWDLDGDGRFGDSSAASPAYIFGSNGTRTVSLRVADSEGLTDVATIVITVGNSPPTAVIDSPSASLLWRVGQVISFAGRASDPQQGTLGASALTWALTMNHCATPDSCHEHPVQEFAGVGGGSFTAPDHEYPSYLTLRLTARDAGGLQHSVTRRLDPQTVVLRFESSPTGLEVNLGSETLVTPASRTVIAGSSSSISASTPQTLGGRSYSFTSWSDGGAQTHNITAGTSSATYVASFRTSSTALPPEWSASDVGSAGSAGSATYDAGTFALHAYGQDVWSTSDAFHYVHRTWAGDGEIVAQVTGLSRPAGASFALAGIMFRESMAANARHAAVLIGTDGKLKFRRRTTVGGTTLSDGPSAGSVSMPYWVKLTRAGNIFTAYRSADGSTWTQTGPTLTLSLPATLRVGLVALRSGAAAPATIARFGNIAVTAREWASDDVGAVGTPGSFSPGSTSSVLRGAGSDVWSTADAFHFAHRTWSGDGDLVVRIDGLVKPGSSRWAMAGIMFRESLSASARHATLLLSTDGKLKFRRRASSGGIASSDGPSAGSSSAPRWLKLTRRGTVFAAYQSGDGVTWTSVHTAQTIALPGTVEVGVWTLRNGGDGLSEATVSSMAISGPPQ